MKLPKLILVLVIILVMACGAVAFFCPGRKKTVVINDIIFSAEVAITQEQKSRGLSGRRELCSKCAMLFLFEKKDEYAFWMKNMEFNLDIIWIKDGNIAKIDKDISHVSGEEYRTSSSIDSVLEINAGASDKYGFKVGDKVTIK